MGSNQEERERALALLRSHHRFPGAYEFRVVARAGSATQVLTAVSAAGGVVHRVRERRSRHGTYVSLAVKVEVDSAERVLDTYEVLSGLDNVVTTL